MENYIDLLLDILCISIPVGILVICAIVGIRMRLRRAEELKRELEHFDEKKWRSSSGLTRARAISVIQISLVLVMLVLLVLWLRYTDPELRIALLCVFGVALIMLVIFETLRRLLLGK